MEKIIYRNADIVTMNPAQPAASAFCVLNGRIWAVGHDEEAESWGSGCPVVDLKGLTVVPGFLETHNHFSWYSGRLDHIDCSVAHTRSIDDIKSRLREKADTVKPDEWILAHSYDDTMIADKRHLTRYDLDEAAPDNPVLVTHISGHLVYVNSRLLEMAGIGPDTPQPEGAEIRKDENGIPTGLLLEPAAIAPVLVLLPQPAIAELKEAFIRGAAHVHATGVTGVHDAAIGALGNGADIVRAYRELAAEKRLGLRVYLTIMHGLYDWYMNLGLGTGFGDEDLKMGCVKMIQDGSIQGRTAALSEPYHDSRDTGFRSGLIMPQEQIDGLVLKYHREGLQLAIHANGDAAIESAILAVERAQAVHPRPDPRHMLIHAQTARPEHLPRMKKAGIVPSYFVNHVYYWGDRHVAVFLGPERAARISPLASSIKAGLRFTLHSDLPVTAVDPLHSIHNAVNRKTRNGDVLGPDERISPMDALKAYTTWAAEVSFEEHLKGSIEPGKLADFVVLSANPLRVDSGTIKDIRVLRTVVGGRTVFEAE